MADESEYPSDDVEAFQSTGNKYSRKDVSNLGNIITSKIIHIFGADIKQDALKDLNFEKNVNGKLSM